MFAAILACVFTATLVDPPKQPDLGFPWRVVDLRGANEIKIVSEYYSDRARWVRLYGVDLPVTGRHGYTGSREDLEILLGRRAEVYFEDDSEKQPVNRNATYVQYMWTRGKLLEFELVRDGWATVNEEGRKGKYAKFLIGAEAEAKRFHEGLWGDK